MKKTDNIQDAQCSCSPERQTGYSTVVDEILEFTGTEKDKVISILQELQKRLGYLPGEALNYICRKTEITPGQISGVATFYSQFRHHPAGKHTVRVCMGTACHVKGAPLISEAFRRSLRIGEFNTSPDSLFSVEEVACLGCCTLAPVIQIDDKTYGHVKPADIDDIIKDFLGSRNSLKAEARHSADVDSKTEVRIGIGSCCVAGGSKEIISEVFAIKERYNLSLNLKPVGCVGVCNQTPLLEIISETGKKTRFTNVKTYEVESILLKHIKPGKLKKKLMYALNDLADTFLSDFKAEGSFNVPDEMREKQLNNFLQDQVHIATFHNGELSPGSLFDYQNIGGFNALKKCLEEPDVIIKTITESGLRGRGGAGFLTGKKWEIAASGRNKKKYVVCNGDEGDPGAFMDRMLLESFPFRIIEGMIIAGIATGSDEGIFYIRAEYPLAVTRIRGAIKQCYDAGLIGDHILDTKFNFNIRVFEGAGAFVCGEETALIASLEGKRGTPHIRPPYPAVKGYKNCPTLVNNVETLSMVPWIISNGPEKFNSIGTIKSKGTKVFALAGKIAKGGLIEVPMGTTIRQIVENIGGGVSQGITFKAVQIGGPSGGCIPAEEADTPVDYEELAKLGAMMGSGGLVVLDNTDCMVDMAKYFLTFTHKQSCGKCTFCRVGTRHMLDILTRLTEGKAEMTEIDELEKLCVSVKNGSLCGLGKTAPNPVITGLRYFREEYEEHTKGFCRSGKCRNLVKYLITDNCTGCTKCSQNCPVDAIAFAPYEKHVINQELCTKCDNCRVVCPENAVELIST